MVETLVEPESQTGQHSFDSDDCPEPNCPGPKRAKDGNFVCGMEGIDGAVTIGGLGHSALTNCAIGFEISLQNMLNPPDVSETEGDEDEDDEKDDDEESDLYLA